MAIYTLSDPHLSLGVKKPMDIFSARWLDHDKKIATQWRRVVGEQDTVVVGGDISWGISLEEAREDLHFIDRLPGKKIFLKGNHDYWWTTVKKVNDFFAAEEITSIALLQNNAIPVEDVFVCGTRGWYSDAANAPEESDYKKIVARETARLRLSLDSVTDPDRPRIVFTHFPPYFENYVCRPLIDTLHEYGITRCYYGHIHGVYALPRVMPFEGIDFSLVSADYLDFTPIPVNTEGKNAEI